MIVIKHKEYPNPLYISGEKARSFPLEEMKTKAGGIVRVRAVPLQDLLEEVIPI